MRFDSGTRWLVNLEAALATFICAVLFAASAANPQPAKAERIVIEYVEPANPIHKPLYELLKHNQVLERARDLLVAVRWPRTLRLELSGCDGESNAWYMDAVITGCYEFLEGMWSSANSAKRPSSITWEDAFVGPLTAVFLHEASHALFDLLKIPLLGREEDAADQLAAYFVLQLPKETKRRLILGGAYAYASELKGRHVLFADEHGTPAQRLYNLLCVAYGSDKELFADIVEKGFLPTERAEICEYGVSANRLCLPHADRTPYGP